MECQYKKYFDLEITNDLISQTSLARQHKIDSEAIIGMFSAAKDHAPNVTLCLISSMIKAQKNQTVEFIDSLHEDEKEKVISFAITQGRKHHALKRKNVREMRKEMLKQMAEKVQRKNVNEKKEVIANIENFLNGKLVGKEIRHAWYNQETHSVQMYSRKVKKVRRKKYVITYGNADSVETFCEDVEDYEVQPHELAADLFSNDLKVL